ncbi:MAG: Ldh family oxidoreductase [Pseudomonadota bacterium]
MVTTATDDWVHIPAGGAERLIAAMFERKGCHAPEAGTIARRLVGANLRGHDSHGVIRSPRYVDWIDVGRVRPNVTAVVERENDVMAVVDACQGFGQTAGEVAVDVGTAKATQQGVAVVALKNAGHLGRIGDWAERAGEAGCASIHMVNVRGSLLVAPFGGIDRRGSTSPFCLGMPTPNGTIVHDFATSLVAEGKALVALRGGKPLPDGALIDEHGNLTSDPQPLYGQLLANSYPDPSKGPGALTGFGLHKGAGLNFFMELFAGALTGSGVSHTAGATERRPFANGMLSIFMHVEQFQPGSWLADEVQGYIEFYKSARPAEEGGEVLIPGEKEQHTMTERLAHGLPLARQTWDDIVGKARIVGLSDDEIEALLAG